MSKKVAGTHLEVGEVGGSSVEACHDVLVAAWRVEEQSVVVVFPSQEVVLALEVVERQEVGD